MNIDIKKNKVTINKLKNIHNSLNVKYYLKIINEKNYIKNEIINTIAITESNSTILIAVKEENGKLVFILNDSIELDTYYYINAYSLLIIIMMTLNMFLILIIGFIKPVEKLSLQVLN